MNPTSTSRRRVPGIFFVLARWLLGAAFVYMGLSKAWDPVGFLKSVHQYDVVQNHLVLNSIAAVLPWFEVFCGLLLLAGIAVRGTSLILLLLLVGFSWLVTHRAMEIMALKAIPFCAVKFDCGCGTGEEFICRKITENLVLLFLAACVFFADRKKLTRRQINEP